MLKNNITSSDIITLIFEYSIKLSYRVYLILTTINISLNLMFIKLLLINI